MDEAAGWLPNATLNATLEPPSPPGISGVELKHGLPLTIIICVAYLAVFIVGVLGNICVVLVVCCFPRMRSLTNLFIANLAVADLLVNVVCVPFTLLSNVMDAWVLGDAICKTVPYLQGVSVSASIHTLVCISLERCLAICCPLRCQLDARACRLLITAVWLLSLSITLPWVIVFDVEPMSDGGAMICYEAWPTPFSEKLYFAVAHLSLCYLLPLLCISVCYTLIWRRVCRRKLPGEAQISGSPAEVMLNRSKMKVVKMMLVVVVSFALSWMPLYALVSRLRFGPAMGPEEAHVVEMLMPFAQWLGTSNSCINPIFYAYFNRRFRKCFMTVLSSSPCCSYPRFDYDHRYCAYSRAQRVGTRLPPVTSNLQAAQEEELLQYTAKVNLDGKPSSPSLSPSLLSCKRSRSPSLLSCKHSRKHSGSPSLLSRKRSRSPSLLSRSPSLLSRSPSLLSRSPSLLSRKRSRSPNLLNRSPSLLSRKRSRSPNLLNRSPSPLSRKRSRSPSPISRKRSRSPSLCRSTSNCISSSPSSNLLAEETETPHRPYINRDPHPCLDQRFAVKKLLSAFPRTTTL